MTTREQVFVAYPGRDPALATGIMGAVRKANARPIPIVFEPWPFNDVAGTPLVSPILEKNRRVAPAHRGYNLSQPQRGFTRSALRSAGASELSLPVTKGTEGDRAIAKLVGIFDTLGYFEYRNLR